MSVDMKIPWGKLRGSIEFKTPDGEVVEGSFSINLTSNLWLKSVFKDVYRTESLGPREGSGHVFLKGDRDSSWDCGFRIHQFFYTYYGACRVFTSEGMTLYRISSRRSIL